MRITTLLILPIALMFSVFSVSAQITVTQADMPAVGVKVATVQDTIPTVLPGNAGASQTWNFTAVNSHIINTISCVAPSSTPYASTFPGSNVADTIWGTTGYNYFSSQSTSFSITGGMPIISGFQVVVNFNPYYEQISLPATYNTFDGGSTYGVTKAVGFTYLIYDSAKGTLSINYTDTIDAWGSLQLPTGTYNVLRQKHSETDIDSVFLHNSFTKAWTFYQARTTKTPQYRWYAKGIGYELVTMQMDSANKKVKTVTWYTKPSGINELSNANAKTLVYPNPCSSQVTFKYPAQLAARVSVVDIMGRQLTEGVMENGTCLINTSSFAKGIYMFRITDTKGNVIDRGKFSVQ